MSDMVGVPSELVWVPPVVTVENIKPGDPQVRTLTLTNSNDVPVELSSELMQSGVLFGGGTPLDVSFSLSEEGRCSDNPEAIPAQGTVTVTMVAELPITAGNEYQGQSGVANYIVTATEADVCVLSSPPENPPDALPPTGVAVGGTLLLALVCLAVGVALRFGMRRRRERRGS